MKNKTTTKKASSQIVNDFLEKNNLHKKDFAEMIGVTLSYVYNLIDETIPFSTRGTTLERIATVMEIEPETFEEYKIPQEPRFIDESILFIKDVLKDKKMNTVNFLKAFPRKKRLEIVDILRGAMPIPIDFQELNMIGQTLNLNSKDIYALWEKRLKEVLAINGMNIYANSNIINSMFECARKEILRT